PLHVPPPSHALTVSFTASIPHQPDLRNGRGIGWACPLASMVRQRRVYSPAGRPGSRADPWALASPLGQGRGRPVAGSKPITPGGSAPPGRSPPQRSGAGRTRASDQGAFVKYGSSAGQLAAAGWVQTCTFDKPDTPTWA